MGGAHRDAHLPARGGTYWDHYHPDHPCDYALVAAVASDDVYTRLVTRLEVYGEDASAAWDALASCSSASRPDAVRARTADAAIANQLRAAGPGRPRPSVRAAMYAIARLDPAARMLECLGLRLAEIVASGNAWTFGELLGKLDHGAHPIAQAITAK